MKWDKYFLDLCNSVSLKSPCLSRKIGAILVRDKSIISTGYNGPPRGIPHCGTPRCATDKALQDRISSHYKQIPASTFASSCPRKALGYESGTHMELCPAQHAEENAVSNAARLGTSTLNSTLYLNSIIPCQKCFGTLINAGIKSIVVVDTTPYDDFTEFLMLNSPITIRKFKHQSI